MIKTRLPIQFALFGMLLFEIGRQFHHQPYLCHVYRAMFALAYYGLMRIWEIAAGQHSLKACNVHIGSNKNKILLLLYMSKTHDEGSPPKKIKIMQEEEWNRRKKNFCPFELTRKYIKHRGDYRTDHEPFFIYRNSIPVPPATVRSVLQNLLRKLNLDASLYNCHSFRMGRSTDLFKYGVDVERIKRMGRWRSNVIYKYLRN